MPLRLWTLPSKPVLSAVTSVVHECATVFTAKDPICVDSHDGFLKVTSSSTPTFDTNTRGKYVYKYQCKDMAQNTAVAVSRTVDVVDTKAPTLKLQGNHVVQLDASHVAFNTQTYNSFMTGFSCSDTCDTNPKKSLSAKPLAKLLLPGTFVMKYTCTDHANNKVSALRTVYNIAPDTDTPTATPTPAPTKSPTFQPVDCQVSAWSKWETCSEKCGGGVAQRFRRITLSPKHGGEACGSLTDLKTCNTHPCPIHCEHKWLAWNACDATCDGGSQFRTFRIVVAPKHGGKECPLAKQRTCNMQPCPVNCAMSAWRPWTTCSVTCALGSRTRFRTVDTHANYGGIACPTDVAQKEVCFQKRHCPINCHVSHWGGWNTCSEKCGGGVQTRTRKIVQAPMYDGILCPTLKAEQNCNTHPCAVDW